MVNTNDLPRLEELLKEVCAIFDRECTEVLVNAYYRVLKAQSFEAVSKAVIRLLTDEQRRQVMPTAADIKAIARHLEVQDQQQTYLHCQHQGCEALVAWPPADVVTEHSYYCPRHKPAWQPEWDEEKHEANKISESEIESMLAQATPGAKAFLRSTVKLIFAAIMRRIPITAEEEAAAARMDAPRRPKAFEETARGPGVNPSAIMNHHWLGELPSDYHRRREIVTTHGYRWDGEQAVWRRGRHALTDGQIDGFGDVRLLEEFVQRR